MRGDSIGDPDVLIIPGSKNTIEDLMYLKNSGLDEQIIRLYRKGKRVVGICGGYQILGKHIKDPHATESAIDQINGLGLLDVETVFEMEKTTTQVEAVTHGFKADLESLNGQMVKGYEIHMGQTKRLSGKPLTRISSRLGQAVDVEDGAISEDGKIFGTYIHGIFDTQSFTEQFLNVIRREKGIDECDASGLTYESFKEQEYDKLAELLEKYLDMDKIYEIVGLEKR
jgi:adenosylcobyric acid synthase